MDDVVSALDLLSGEVRRSELRAIRGQIKAAADHGSVRELSDRLDALEDDFRRLMLVALSLCEASVRKGLVSREELQAAAAALDARDGAQDGRLDPRSLWPAPAPRPHTPSEFLRDLEQEAE